MRRLAMGGTILLALLLLATACGDDADSVAATTTPPVTVADGGGTGDTDDPGDDGGDPGDAGDLPAVFSSDDCLAAASAMASAYSGGITPTGTFDSEGIADAFGRMSQVAPSEIQDDLATMAEALGTFFSILEEANVDLTNPASLAAPEAAAAMERAAEALESTDFQEAADNVNAWFENMCP